MMWARNLIEDRENSHLLLRANPVSCNWWRTAPMCPSCSDLSTPWMRTSSILQRVPSKPSSILDMVRWKISGAELIPSKSLLKQKRPYGVTKIVSSFDLECKRICQKPLLASSLAFGYMFFLRINYRFFDVLSRGRGWSEWCSQCSVGYSFCMWSGKQRFSINTAWCGQQGSLLCMYAPEFCVRGLFWGCMTCVQCIQVCPKSSLEFYKKKAKEPLFLHHHSAIPKKAKTTFIRNERQHIQERCSTQASNAKHQGVFDEILRLKGYSESCINHTKQHQNNTRIVMKILSLPTQNGRSPASQNG